MPGEADIDQIRKQLEQLGLRLDDVEETLDDLEEFKDEMESQVWEREHGLDRSSPTYRQDLRRVLDELEAQRSAHPVEDAAE